MMTSSIERYQAAIGAWSDRNFGSPSTVPPGPDTGPTGLVEEALEFLDAIEHARRGDGWSCWAISPGPETIAAGPEGTS